ncbi:MAG: hypothetical protein J3K34DRAFT_437654 [Monoraphidium minutum]|nr:MAG: hypothetical protein J3K34DRAFT_437654 [Monoraphidium minutum]
MFLKAGHDSSTKQGFKGRRPQGATEWGAGPRERRAPRPAAAWPRPGRRPAARAPSRSPAVQGARHLGRPVLLTARTRLPRRASAFQGLGIGEAGRGRGSVQGSRRRRRCAAAAVARSQESLQPRTPRGPWRARGVRRAARGPLVGRGAPSQVGSVLSKWAAACNGTAGPPQSGRARGGAGRCGPGAPAGGAAAATTGRGKLWTDWSSLACGPAGAAKEGAHAARRSACAGPGGRGGSAAEVRGAGRGALPKAKGMGRRITQAGSGRSEGPEGRRPVEAGAAAAAAASRQGERGRGCAKGCGGA